MISKIPVCARIGIVVGFFATLLASAYGEQPFLSGTGTPLPVAPVTGFWSTLLGAFVAAEFFAIIVAVLFAVLFGYLSGPLLVAAVITALPVGVVSGLLAYAIPTAWVAALAGAILGFFLGWIVCWLLCSRGRQPLHVMEVAYGQR